MQADMGANRKRWQKCWNLRGEAAKNGGKQWFCGLKPLRSRENEKEIRWLTSRKLSQADEIGNAIKL